MNNHMEELMGQLEVPSQNSLRKRIREKVNWYMRQECQ